MNFPGLEPGWNYFHRTLKTLGVIRPWDVPKCRSALDNGAKVLVVASTALGDSLLTTPLLQTLAHHLGRDRVGLLVKSPFKDLYAGHPSVGKVFSVRGKFRGMAELREELNGEYQIAMIANCTEPDLVPWLWWCGARGFLRYPTRWSKWHAWFANREMMRRPKTPEYATGHAIDNNLAMAELLGIPAVSRLMQIEIREEVIPYEPPVVLIHPGASSAGKCWPLENWAAVAKALSEKYDIRFEVTGSPQEFGTAQQLVEKLPGVPINQAGKLSLKALARKQAASALFLSGDTGPYHLALAAGCPTVTLFAPRDRGSSVEACGPHQSPPEKHIALQTEGFNIGVHAISVETVLQAAHQLLARRSSTHQEPAR
ncbi:MAG: glycosyltransferase family 9 protein [Verrucomicrobiales bacterium]